MSTATEVKERPILFSGPMVTALLEGRKTQTRRVVKPQSDWIRPAVGPDGVAHGYCGSGPDSGIRCPYGKPGDRLWVRETFRAIEDPGAKDGEVRRKYRDEDGETHYIVVDYKAGAPTRVMDKIGKPGWKPSIHMPRWASRIDLEITEVRVERLHDISEADKVAEGGTSDKPFGTVWRAINTKPGIRWEDNPWVWAVSFHRLESAS